MTDQRTSAASDYADLVRELHQAAEEHDRGHGPLHAAAANAIDHLMTLIRLMQPGVPAQQTPTQETITVPYNPCLAKLRPGEPFFVLLGRDKQAPNAVMTWANDRQAAEGKSDWTEQARQVAYSMAEYSGASAVPSPERAIPQGD
jgi:hypothetical protein